MMNNKLKWILGGTMAVLVSGALFAMPVLAEEQSAVPGNGRGFGMMGGYGKMNPEAMQSMMGSGMMGGMMGGNGMAMHNTMAPLMEQMPAMHDQMSGEVAALLGMTVEELEAAMAEGKTMAQLADEKNVAPGELQSLMTRSMKSFLDKAVEDGTLTKEQANDLFQFHQQKGAGCLTGQPNGGMGGRMFGPRGQQGQ